MKVVYVILSKLRTLYVPGGRVGGVSSGVEPRVAAALVRRLYYVVLQGVACVC